MKEFENIEEAYIKCCKHILQRDNKVLNLIYRIKNFTEKKEDVMNKHILLFSRYYYDDCIRSLTTNIVRTKYEFSYYNRLTKDINQIEAINKRIEKNPSTRKLILTTSNPKIDLNNIITPCLVLIEFNHIAYKEFSVAIIFRAHDYGRRALYNFIAFQKFFSLYFPKITVKEVIFHSINAYIESKDENNIKKLLIQC